MLGTNRIWFRYRVLALPGLILTLAVSIAALGYDLGRDGSGSVAGGDAEPGAGVRIPTEEEAGRRLREVHQLVLDVRTGKRTAQAVCDEASVHPPWCEEALERHEKRGFEGTPEAPPSWTKTYRRNPQHPSQADARVLEIPCNFPDGRAGVNKFLVYPPQERGVLVRDVDYWVCMPYREIGPEGYAEIPLTPPTEAPGD